MNGFFEDPSVDVVQLSDVVVFGDGLPEIGGGVISNSPFPGDDEVDPNG